jgi:hypothetical protein
MPILETIEQAVKLHDKYQVEIKLDYELLPGKQTRYQISTYIFVPQSLGITRDTYSKANFYRDIQDYIRLKTPSLILRDFTSSSYSPLATIAKTISIENWASNPECEERLIKSFKLLGAMLKSAIRDHLNLIQKRISEALPDTKIDLLIDNLFEEFLVESKNITNKYRSFYAAFNLPNVDEEVFTAYKLIDESISLLIEENTVELYQIVETYLKKGDKTNFKQKLSDRVKAETKYRKAHGYSSFLKEEEDNEEYIFRVSVLKKYAASVLFLSTAIQREGTNLEHILFAIAAGLSMVFATVVAFYFQYRFGNFTFPFFIALVVGYMFKDRIKEVGRSLFSRYLQNNLYDRRLVIRTHDGKHKLGILKEKVSFVREKDLPRTAIVARNRDLITELANDGQGERIICYVKDIVLFTPVFKKVFADVPEITGLNNIMRYDIRTYLKKAADAIQEKSYLEDGHMKTALCHKVYHLNFVSKYKSISPQKGKIYKRSRLILDQEGIKRVEHVPL